MKEILNKYFKGDGVIWGILFILFIFSLLAVYSSTGTLAYKYQGGNTSFYLFRHVKFLILGFLVTYITHKIPYRYFSLLSQLLFIVSILLLIFTLFMGVTKNEATRWLTLPGIGINFQTSDFAKLALLMFVARLLSKSQDSEEELKNVFKPIIISIIVICGLILPANFSTAALLFVTAWFLMFIGRIQAKYLFGSIAIVVVFFFFFLSIAINMPSKGRIGTWKKRIENFINEDSRTNYQAEQAKIAIVTGGIFGKGPGNSTQRNFLPHPYSDFIYAIIIEEYGLIGGIFILILYLILLYRTGVIVKKSLRTFSAFLSIGLTISLVFQALINMAVAVNLIPVTGQPLPFVSMGGTSILFTSVAFGIILSVSQGIEKDKIKMETETEIETKNA